MQRDDAERLLTVAIGSAAAVFRDGQWKAIDALVNQRKRMLVVQRTGWGKSSVYFISRRILRDRGQGPTIIISPLLALMRNQTEAAGSLGEAIEHLDIQSLCAPATSNLASADLLSADSGVAVVTDTEQAGPDVAEGEQSQASSTVSGLVDQAAQASPEPNAVAIEMSFYQFFLAKWRASRQPSPLTSWLSGGMCQRNRSTIGSSSRSTKGVWASFQNLCAISS